MQYHQIVQDNTGHSDEKLTDVDGTQEGGKIYEYR